MLLAAGAGTRYGMPKALAEGGAWLRSGVAALRDGGCDEVVVVLAAALVDAGNDIDAALAAAERAQLRYGRRLVEQGIALGSDWPARRA